MTRGQVLRSIPSWQEICIRCCLSFRSAITTPGLVVFIFCLAALSLPLAADSAVTIQTHPATSGDDFGQYLVDHQAELAPFFDKNGKEMIRLAVPTLLGMAAWVIIITMAVGWVIDVLMSRGYAYFFAPAFAEWKRSVIYASGRLFLSFVYTGLLILAVVVSLKLTYAAIILSVTVILLLIVALAAQLVWILYLYRTNIPVSIVFYLAIMATHTIVSGLLAKPLIVMRMASVTTDIVDHAITPKLVAEAEATKHDLAEANSARMATQAKIDDLQGKITLAQTEADQLRNEIEQKKDSDIYVLSQSIHARARGDLGSARDQLTAFLAKFPSSSLTELARAQLSQINDAMTADQVQKKKAAADEARAAEQARADLLERVGKGEVTLSEIRQVLIGKSRADVSNLLGLPSETASNSWGYTRQMILNPLTNEKHGLTVYFLEGAVQGVDYNFDVRTP